MSQENFLKALQTFDDNFNLMTGGNMSLDNINKSELKEDKYSQFYNRINMVKIRNIMNRSSEENCGEKDKEYKCNCFEPFYKLEFDELMFFFSELSKTHLGLVYLDDFSEKWKDAQKQKNRDDTFVGKIDDVLKMAKEVNYSLRKETINDLKYLQNTLNNKHFTERQLFKNLLCTVALLLNNMKQGRMVARVTNCLIKEYFSRDETFTRDTDISKYTETTYRYYDDKGISLFHE